MRVLVVTNMYPYPETPAFGVFVEDQVESLRRRGVEVDVLFMNGRESTLNYAWGIARIWKRLLTRRYDLVHAHYVFSGLAARMQFLRPVVLTHHGVEVFWGGQAWLSRRITRFFDQVIVVSEEMRRRLPYPDAHVIPCGVNMDRFQPMPKAEARRHLGLPEDKKLVLWAGEYFRPEKRYELVEEAVRLLQEDDDSVELVLLSGKAHDDVPAYMNACDVLLLVSDGEGSPMVVKEAMACNLPVVAHLVGDVEQIIGGTEGCHICSQDPRDIADKARLALDRGERTRGREVVQHLSIDTIAERITDVYGQALSSANGPRIDATQEARAAQGELVKG
ncbi:MAG: glycosyltransferase family 4 protein [Chloroflexota bacterium]